MIGVRPGTVYRGPVDSPKLTSALVLLQVSQPRLTHLMALRLLCPDIQQAILLGELAFGDKELRALARIADWSEQKAMVAARTASRRCHPIAEAKQVAEPCE